MIIKAEKWQRQALTEVMDISEKVSEILSDIAKNNDEAVDRYAQLFDKNAVRFIKLRPFDDYPLSEALKNSIKLAASRIESFARFQKSGVESKIFEDEFGRFGQVVLPIERVGAYIPGGRFPLISTALMTLIPAKVAGSPVRIACSPSDDPAILAAASLAGATCFIKMGGVQAIGALTYGYQSVEPVNLIVGPGNAWVNEAKKQVQSKVKIDGLAGPSELLALCDETQPIDWLALDALAQAEHDPMAVSIIASDNADWLVEVLAYLEKSEETHKLLKDKQIELVFADSVEKLIQFSEDFAPEHLMLCHRSINEAQLTNFGSLFIGANSAVALGDYISGPNHTLPTLGYAKQSGGLSVNTYLKVLTVQEVNARGRKVLSENAVLIAEAEGLIYHRDSLQIRK
ncbi:histidinol dehydrogenase [Aliikangiella sp. G2MR2-5]|uniref:histidinol dehydrogenase n=1 Tax=Aliikangiella sp. G2MR2-5 TaxID=2788943 RepID=UPI0018AA446D|nr:histidinol dehydrogenase [Aliikangiella sp. G2MR2-5]